MDPLSKRRQTPKGKVLLERRNLLKLSLREGLKKKTYGDKNVSSAEGTVFIREYELNIEAHA
jgi:hypothetical protein